MAWFFYAGIVFLLFDLMAGFGFKDEIFWPIVLVPQTASHSLFLWTHPLLYGMGTLLHITTNRLAVLILTYTLFFVPVCVLVYGLRHRIGRALVIGLATMTLTTVLKFAIVPGRIIREDVRPLNGPSRSGMPNIVFLIMDEHIGVEGILPTAAKATELKNQLIDDYTSRGFNVYGRAYSNYYYTSLSIPSILNHSIPQDHRSLSDSYLLLESLRRQGYALNIYQSTHLDFCKTLSGQYHQCFEYSRNSVGFLAQEKMPMFQKALVLSAAFAEAQQSTGLRKAWWILSEKFKSIPWGRFEPMSFPVILSKIKADMRTQTNGTVFFAHFLMPHSPYRYTSECQIADIADWDYRLIDSPNAEKSRVIKNSRYLQQVACTHKSLESLWAVMRETGTYEASTIFLMGDHGSRIFSVMPYLDDERNTPDLNLATDRNLVALFSAFLAVKPGKKNDAGIYDGNKIPLATVAAEVFGLPDTNSGQARFDKIYLRRKKNREFFPFEMTDF